jgi:hypothetical protein
MQQPTVSDPLGDDTEAWPDRALLLDVDRWGCLVSGAVASAPFECSGARAVVTSWLAPGASRVGGATQRRPAGGCRS